MSRGSFLERGERVVWRPRPRVRWTIERDWFCYWALLEIDVETDPDAPLGPCWVECGLAFLDVPMGYTVKAFTHRRLERKMRKAEANFAPPKETA